MSLSITTLEHLQERRLHHFPGQPVLDSPKSNSYILVIFCFLLSSCSSPYSQQEESCAETSVIPSKTHNNEKQEFCSHYFFWIMQNHSKSPWQGMGNKPEIASTSITFCSANCRILLFGKLNFCEVRFKIEKNKATKQNQNVTRNNISLALLIKVANCEDTHITRCTYSLQIAIQSKTGAWEW